MTMALRPIHERDHGLLREIYADAVESQAPGSYSPAQVRAWASLAWLPGVLDRTFAEGSGWISGSGDAFAIRYPSNRLALLYCRGRASGRGHATALLDRLEAEAASEPIDSLTTEASQLSRPLLEKRGWRLIAPEHITIAGVSFERYQMSLSLRHEHS